MVLMSVFKAMAMILRLKPYWIINAKRLSALSVHFINFFPVDFCCEHCPGGVADGCDCQCQCCQCFYEFHFFQSRVRRLRCQGVEKEVPVD